MFWILVGLSAGAAVALGRIPVLRVPLDAAVATLLSGSDRAAAWLTDNVFSSVAASQPDLHAAAQVAFSAMAPGVVAAALVLAAQATLAVRRGIGGLLLAAAFGAFFVLPWQQSVPAFFLLAATAVLAWVTVGPVAVTGLAALAGVIGTRQIMLLTGMDGRGIPESVNALNADHQTLAIFFAALPLVAAAAAFLGLMHDGRSPAYVESTRYRDADDE